MKVTAMRPYSTKDISPSASSPSDVFSQKTFPKAFGLNFSNFKKDDWLLLGIIAVLVMEGSDDYVLLCALGYLFAMGL